MSEKIKGSVHYVSEKDYKGKKLYSIKLDNGTFYGTGNKHPGAEVGDLVLFNASKNDRGYWNIEGAIKVKPGAGTKPERKFGGGGKGGYSGGGFKQDPATQAAIIMQNASTTAAALITAALAHDALPLPAKKAEKLQGLIDAHHKITEEVFKASLGVYVAVKGGAELTSLIDEPEEEPEKETLDDDDWDEDQEDTPDAGDDDEWDDDDDFS